MFSHNGFQREVPGPSASAWPQHVLEMQIWGHHPRPVNSDAMGVGPRMGRFHEPSRRFWCMLKFGNHCSYIKKRMLSPLYTQSEVEVAGGVPPKVARVPKCSRGEENALSSRLHTPPQFWCPLPWGAWASLPCPLPTLSLGAVPGFPVRRSLHGPSLEAAHTRSSVYICPNSWG